MSTATNNAAHTPTVGPWKAVEREVLEDGGVYPSHVVGGPDEYLVCYLEAPSVATLAIKEPDSGWSRSKVNSPNTNLICEAGTVFHETGLTPRQLAEQRAELLEALRDLLPLASCAPNTDEERAEQEFNNRVRRAGAAIAKAGAK